MGQHAKTEKCPKCGVMLAKVGMVAHLAHRHGFVQVDPEERAGRASKPERSPKPSSKRRAPREEEPEEDPEEEPEIDSDELL